jgi:hypothetical protein
MAFKTVEWVRKVRDKHREETRRMSPDERAAYYRRKAEAVRAKLARRSPSETSDAS